MQNTIRRHGDVVLKTNAKFKIPKDSDLKPDRLAHRGNNHDHFFHTPFPLMSEMKDGKRFMRVESPTIIDHEEHGKGDLPVGDYWLEIKSEYDHLTEESRAVID